MKPYSGKWMVCSVMNNQQQQQQQRQPSIPPSTKNMANPKSRRPSFLNSNLQPSPDFMAGSIEWSVECIRPVRGCQEDADGPMREDRAFRNGLQRNILQLSNLARVNQEKIARLEEQLRSKDEELAALQKQSEERLSQPVTPEENERPGATVTGRLLKLVSCGNMLGIASRVGVDTIHSLKETGQPLGGYLTEEDIAAIALGAQQTEQNLIRLNRETRSQLERTVRDAEAHRRDKEAALSANAVAKHEKAKLEARVARLSDELKLQAAALTTLQLEVTNARKETERLKEERKDNRLRQKDAEKVSSEANQRIENLEFELSETKKAFQRERLRASMLEDIISKDSKQMAEKDEEERYFCKQVARFEEAHSEQSDAEQHTAASILRARATKEDNHRLLLGLKQLQRRRGECGALHEHELEAELKREIIFLRQSQSLRAWLCRAVDELRDAAEVTKLSMTCPRCKKLFRDPHILTPCGHTFCAKCCGGGGDGSTLKNEPCWACKREGVRAKDGTRLRATVPNHVVAALLENFAFHRELLDTLKQASVEMWREGLHITR